MLPYSITNNPDAIEKEFCVHFSKLPIEEMNSKDKQMFLQITHMREEIGDKEEGIQTLMKVEGYPILEQLQNKMLTAKFCFRTKLWLLHLCKGDMSLAYLYLIYVQYCAKQNPIIVKKEENVFRDRTLVDFRFFCEKCFPEGFPNALSIQALFNGLFIETPTGRKNLIEFSQCMKSIQFGKLFAMSSEPDNIQNNTVETKKEAEPTKKIPTNFAIPNSLLNFALKNKS